MLLHLFRQSEFLRYFKAEILSKLTKRTKRTIFQVTAHSSVLLETHQNFLYNDGDISQEHLIYC